MNANNMQSTKDIYSRFVGMAAGLGDLTPEKESSLLDRRDSGDGSAIHELALHTVRFIVTRQRKRHPMGGDILEDALNNALMRAIRAADRFDRASGNRFMAYAGLFIDGALTDSLVAHMDVMGAGRTAQYDASSLNKFRYQFCHEHDNLPTDEQIQDALGYSAGRIAFLDSLLSSRMESATVYEDGTTQSAVEQVEDSSDDALTQLEQAHRTEIIERAKANMTLKQREAFELVAEQGNTWSKVCELLGIANGSLAERLEGATVKVRKEIMRDG